MPFIFFSIVEDSQVYYSLGSFLCYISFLFFCYVVYRKALRLDPVYWWYKSVNYIAIRVVLLFIRWHYRFFFSRGILPWVAKFSLYIYFSFRKIYRPLVVPAIVFYRILFYRRFTGFFYPFFSFVRFLHFFLKRFFSFFSKGLLRIFQSTKYYVYFFFPRVSILFVVF